MPQRERSRRMRALRRRVRENDVAKWSATFLETLTGAGIIAPGVPDPLAGGDHRPSRAPSGCSSRSTSTARSPRSSTGRRMPAPPTARAPRSSARGRRRHPRRDRLGSRAREPRRGREPARRHPAQRIARRRAPARSGRRHDRPARLRDGRSSSGSPRIVEEVARVPTAPGSSASRPGSPCTRAGSSTTAGTALQHVGPRQGRGRAPRHHGAHGQGGARVRGALERQGRVADPPAPARRRRRRRSTSATTSPTRTRSPRSTATTWA